MKPGSDASISGGPRVGRGRFLSGDPYPGFRFILSNEHATTKTCKKCSKNRIALRLRRDLCPRLWTPLSTFVDIPLNLSKIKERLFERFCGLKGGLGFRVPGRPSPNNFSWRSRPELRQSRRRIESGRCVPLSQSACERPPPSVLWRGKALLHHPRPYRRCLSAPRRHRRQTL